MSLLTLDIDTLALIINQVDITDKTNLITAGCSVLIAKLERISTKLIVTPLKNVYMCSKCATSCIHDRHDTEIKTRVTCTNMEDSIYSTKAIEQIYVNLSQLWYKSARKLTTYGQYLERALQCLPKLESLRIYLPNNMCHLLETLPTSILHLNIAVDAGYTTYMILSHLSSNVISLKLKRFTTNGITDRHLEIIGSNVATLPPNLETLTGVSFEDAIVPLLPKSLTRLEYRSIFGISHRLLPPHITELTATSFYSDNVFIHDILALSHLPLRKLECSCQPGADLHNLSLLRQLISIKLGLVHTGNWNESIVDLPSSLTHVRLAATENVHFNIPASVNKSDISGPSWSVFMHRYNKWRYAGRHYPSYIPSNVKDANIRISYLQEDELRTLLDKLKNTVIILYLNTDSQIRGGKFDVLSKCINLYLPSIPPFTLPVSLMYMYVQNLSMLTGAFSIAKDILPAGLKQIKTKFNLPADIKQFNLPADIKQFNLEHLECGGALLLKDLSGLSHIPTVVLWVYNRKRLPDLPPNISFKYF